MEKYVYSEYPKYPRCSVVDKKHDNVHYGNDN